MRFALTKLPPTRQLEGCRRTKATGEEQQSRDPQVQAERPPTPTTPADMPVRHTPVATAAAITAVMAVATAAVAPVTVAAILEDTTVAAVATAEAAETVEATAVAVEMVVEGVVMAVEAEAGAVAMAAEAARSDDANSRPMTTISWREQKAHAHSRISQSWCTRNTLKLNKCSSN